MCITDNFISCRYFLQQFSNICFYKLIVTVYVMIPPSSMRQGHTEVGKEGQIVSTCKQALGFSQVMPDQQQLQFLRPTCLVPTIMRQKLVVTIIDISYCIVIHVIILSSVLVLSLIRPCVTNPMEGEVRLASVIFSPSQAIPTTSAVLMTVNVI